MFRITQTSKCDTRSLNKKQRYRGLTRISYQDFDKNRHAIPPLLDDLRHPIFGQRRLLRLSFDASRQVWHEIPVFGVIFEHCGCETLGTRRSGFDWLHRVTQSLCHFSLHRQGPTANELQAYHSGFDLYRWNQKTRSRKTNQSSCLMDHVQREKKKRRVGNLR